MPISSTSTDAEVLAQYEDNIAAAETSAASAASALHALRVIRLRRPTSGAFAGRSFTYADIESEISRLQGIVAGGGLGAAGRVRFRLDGKGGFN